MLQRFLGWPRRAGAEERIRLRDVEEALARYEVPGGLRAVVEAIIGPIPVLPK